MIKYCNKHETISLFAALSNDYFRDFVLSMTPIDQVPRMPSFRRIGVFWVKSLEIRVHNWISTKVRATNTIVRKFQRIIMTLRNVHVPSSFFHSRRTEYAEIVDNSRSNLFNSIRSGSRTIGMGYHRLMN